MVQYIVNFTDPERTPFNVNSFTTDGPVAPNTLQLSSSAVRASTGLLLYGKGHPEYGERIQENLVNLMEHFSGATEPTFPISGQMWFARITYVILGTGSPGTASNIFRWEDDDTLSKGGQWVALTPVVGNPTAADEVKIGGNRPTTVVDGSFWFDTSGSPIANALYVGVNNTSSNLSATFLEREIEDLTGLVTAADLTAKSYLPQKQMKVYDGNAWKNVGGVYTSDVAPQRPAEGDLWYNTGQNDAGGSPQLGSPATTPQNQLFIWQSGQWRPTGYVDRGGDVMTGTLSFGLPTSSLWLWEGRGDVTQGPDIRMRGDGLVAAGQNYYVHIAGSPTATTQVFEVAAGDSFRGNETSLFQVRADGVIRTALGTGSPNPYKVLILAGDDNTLVNRAYVDSTNPAAQVAINTANIAANAAHIDILQGGGSPVGSPYEPKVNRSGDTMTGTLVFSIGGSPQSGVVGIDMGDLLINNLQYPQAPENAANRQYVDDQIASLFGSPAPAGFNDGVVFAGTFDSNTNVLTLNRTEGLSDVTVPFTFSFDAADVDHTIITPFLRDTFQETKFGSPLFGSPVTAFPLEANLQEILRTPFEQLNRRVTFVELPRVREVIVLGVGSPLTGGGSPASTLAEVSFTADSYIAGTDRLKVYVNGVKQYANERARQSIQFNTSLTLLSSTTRTLLNNDSTSYTLDVAVDGGGATTVTADGANLQIFQDIVDEINAQVTNATAVWNFPQKRIDVYSNTTGTGSQIDITDAGSPIGSSLLGALATTIRPGVGSPIPGAGSPVGTATAYTIGNITPPSGGRVSTVVQDLAYFEAGVGSPLIDATFGEVTSTIVFNTQQQAGDIIELLYEPVQE